MTTVKLSKNLQNPRGVYSIPVTPFHENGKLDLDSLRKCIEFCLEKGAHGIVMPVNASEVSNKSTLLHLLFAFVFIKAIVFITSGFASP